MGDYIPKGDAAFDTWFANYQAYIAVHAAELGLSPAQALEVLSAKTMWALAYSNHIAAQAAAGAARATKEAKLAEAVAVIRAITNFIQSRRETTDAQRAALVITVPDRVPTPTDPEAIRRISPPEMELDYSKPQQVTIHCGPYPKDERRNGFKKPATGFELEVLNSAVPAGTENLEALPWQPVGIYPHSPALVIIGHAATVTFRARYVDHLNNVGPWGPPESCSVTA